MHLARSHDPICLPRGHGLRAQEGISTGRTETEMVDRTLVIMTGLALAAWGHLLVHDLLGAAEAWVRADERFPPSWRSSPTFAGRAMLAMGTVLVLVPVFG